MKVFANILLTCLILLSGNSLCAQNGFESGNAAYRKGDFVQAAAAYESVLSTKKESVELYFNLGNSYYKMGKVAPAIYNYEKALLLDPANAEVMNNLKFAQKLQIDEVKTVPKVGFHKIVEDYTSAFSEDGWAWSAVISAFVVLLFFCGYYFSATTLVKRLFFIGMGLGILWLLLSLFAAYFVQDTRQADRPAIVFASSSGVRSEPQMNAQDAFLLHEGTKVQVLEELDQWKKVELPDGNSGWIRSADIKELK